MPNNKQTPMGFTASAIRNKLLEVIRPIIMGLHLSDDNPSFSKKPVTDDLSVNIAYPPSMFLSALNYVCDNMPGNGLYKNLYNVDLPLYGQDSQFNSPPRSDMYVPREPILEMGEMYPSNDGFMQTNMYR